MQRRVSNSCIIRVPANGDAKDICRMVNESVGEMCNKISEGLGDWSTESLTVTTLADGRLLVSILGLAEE